MPPDLQKRRSPAGGPGSVETQSLGNGLQRDSTAKRQITSLVRAIRDDRLQPADVSIYATLLMHERGGTSRPSRVRLAKESGLHLNSIRRSTARLAACGYVQIAVSNGRNTNLYTIAALANRCQTAPGSDTVPGRDSTVVSRTKRRPNKERATPAATPHESFRTRFAEFWAVYPRLEARVPAEKVWRKQDLDRFADAIVADVEARSACAKQWKGIERRFIPLPATYLNGARWRDEWRAEVQPSTLAQIPAADAEALVDAALARLEVTNGE